MEGRSFEELDKIQRAKDLLRSLLKLLKQSRANPFCEEIYVRCGENPVFYFRIKIIVDSQGERHGLDQYAHPYIMVSGFRKNFGSPNCSVEQLQIPMDSRLIADYVKIISNNIWDEVGINEVVGKARIVTKGDYNQARS